MPTRPNRFYNDPQIGQIAANLTDALFGSPERDAQRLQADAYRQQLTQGQTVFDQQQADRSSTLQRPHYLSAIVAPDQSDNEVERRIQEAIDHGVPLNEAFTAGGTASASFRAKSALAQQGFGFKDTLQSQNLAYLSESQQRTELARQASEDRRDKQLRDLQQNLIDAKAEAQQREIDARRERDEYSKLAKKEADDRAAQLQKEVQKLISDRDIARTRTRTFGTPASKAAKDAIHESLKTRFLELGIPIDTPDFHAVEQRAYQYEDIGHSDSAEQAFNDFHTNDPKVDPGIKHGLLYHLNPFSWTDERPPSLEYAGGARNLSDVVLPPIDTGYDTAASAGATAAPAAQPGGPPRTKGALNLPEGTRVTTNSGRSAVVRGGKLVYEAQ